MTAQDFDQGVWFRSACSGLWYRSKESAGDIDAWKEDGMLHVLAETRNCGNCRDYEGDEIMGACRLQGVATPHYSVCSDHEYREGMEQ